MSDLIKRLNALSVDDALTGNGRATCEEAADRLAELQKKFGHYHKGPGYRCGACGLGLTDEIHLRVEQ